MNWNDVKIFFEGFTQGEITIIVLQVIWFFSIFYFQQYFVKKGELKAINENFQTQLRQMEQITQNTTQIEKKISNSYLIQHEQWMLKREIYLGMLELLNDLGDCLSRLLICLSVDKELEFKNEISNKDFKDIIESKEFLTIYNKINRQTVKAQLILNDKSNEALNIMNKKIIDVTGGWVPNPPSRKGFNQCFESVGDAIRVITKSAKEDLGIL